MALAGVTGRIVPQQRLRYGARQRHVPRGTMVRASWGSPDDSGFASISQLMDRQMVMMDREMSDMMRQMDRDMAEVMGRTQRMEQEIDRAVARARSQAEQSVAEASGSPNIQIRRSEERGTGSYRYYESISITSGPRYYSTAPQAALGPSPLLFAAALLAGMYAAVAAAFARSYHLTTYKEANKWQLIAAWPVLLLFSPAFRGQFMAALRGEVRAAEGEQQQGKP